MILRDMTKEEYDRFHLHVIRHFAEEIAEYGGAEDFETASRISSDTINGLLPEGYISRGHHFLAVEAEERKVGYVWYKEHAASEVLIALLCGLFINENERKKGFGKAALVLFENHAKENGCDKVALGVLKSNEVAVSLYTKTGYGIEREKPVVEDGPLVKYHMTKAL